MTTTYIDYDEESPVGQMVSEMVGHLAVATGLCGRIKKTILAMNDAPASDANIIESKLGLQAGEGSALYSAICDTEEDLANANVWQKLDHGMVL